MENVINQLSSANRLLLLVLTWLLTGLLGLPIPGQAQQMGVAIIRGTISSPVSDSIFLAWHPSLLDDKEQRLLARLDDDHSFAISLPLNGPVVAELVYRSEAITLWLEPGTELQLRFKAKDISNSIKFKGPQAAVNTYLADHERTFVDNEEWQVLPYNIMFYEEGFIKFLDHRLERERAELAIFLAEEEEKGAVSAAFRDFAQADLTFSWANDRLTYQDLREQVVSNEGRLAVSPGYFDFLRVVNIDTQTALLSPTYQTFLTNYLAWQLREEHHRRADPDYFSAAYQLAHDKFSGEVEAVMLGRILRDSFRNGHLKRSLALFDDYRISIDTQGRYVPLLAAELETTRLLALGAPAPDFALQTPKGDTISLRQFVGKMVYLTFWKSTSGQSLRDLPYQQDLARRLQDKVAFVSVSLDDDRAVWQRIVTNKNLNGAHVYAGAGLQAPLARLYELKELPAYLLIAEDGTIANRRLLRVSNPGAQSEIVSQMGRSMPPPPPPPVPQLIPEPEKVAEVVPAPKPATKPAPSRTTRHRRVTPRVPNQN